MPNPENLIGKGNRFTSENQPENAGRKKNIWKHLRDEYDLSAEDVAAIIMKLSSMNKEELKAFTEDSKTSMLELAFASAYIQAVKKGTLSELETMLNRTIGKVKDNVSITSDLPISIIIKDAERTNLRSTSEVKTDVQQST